MFDIRGEFFREESPVTVDVADEPRATVRIHIQKGHKRSQTNIGMNTSGDKKPATEWSAAPDALLNHLAPTQLIVTICVLICV